MTMKKIRVSNFTNADIVVSLPSSNIGVKVGESIIIETNERYLRVLHGGVNGSSFRVSEFPATMFKNRWVISLICCLSFDCLIDLNNVKKDLIVSERHFVFRDEILFSCLLVNSEFATKYIFSKKSDKVKSLIFLASISLLYVALSLLLTVAVVSLLFEDFHIAYIFVLIITIGLMVGSVNHLIKSIKFFNIDSNFEKIISDCKMIEILRCNKFLVKYCNEENA